MKVVSAMAAGELAGEGVSVAALAIAFSSTSGTTGEGSLRGIKDLVADDRLVMIGNIILVLPAIVLNARGVPDADGFLQQYISSISDICQDRPNRPRLPCRAAFGRDAFSV